MSQWSWNNITISGTLVLGYACYRWYNARIEKRRMLLAWFNQVEPMFTSRGIEQPSAWRNIAFCGQSQGSWALLSNLRSITALQKEKNRLERLIRRHDSIEWLHSALDVAMRAVAASPDTITTLEQHQNSIKQYLGLVYDGIGYKWYDFTPWTRKSLTAVWSWFEHWVETIHTANTPMETETQSTDDTLHNITVDILNANVSDGNFNIDYDSSDDDELNETNQYPMESFLNEMICPITLRIMRRPMILLADGRTYEKRAIQRHIMTQHRQGMTIRSPVTNESLEQHIVLIPNDSMERMIMEIKERLDSEKNRDLN